MQILFVVKRIMNIIMIVAPILAIIFLSVLFTKKIINPDDKKILSSIDNLLKALLVLFLIPAIVNAAMYILGSKTNFSSCWNNATNRGYSSNYYEINDNNKNNLLDDSNDYEKGIKKNNNNSSKSTDQSNNASLETNYGVFLGLDHNSGLDKLYSYKLVVIDLQEFDKSDVDKLHSRGIKVYSYLNVGSVEEYRSYYKRF